jgi:bacterial/archaeal transporter family protein
VRIDSWLIPVWLWYALIGIFLWGLWGFLSKIGTDTANPFQMQMLFTFGMLPVAGAMLLHTKEKLDRNLGGITYGLLCGIATGAGTLGYYAALQHQSASVVTPVTGLFPVLTVVLAFALLRERLNRVQIAGMFLALTSVVILSI